jgi:hypothetical protein
VNHIDTNLDDDDASVYWKSSLQGAEPTLLHERGMPDTPFFSSFRLVVTQVSELQERCQQSGLGLQALVLAVWGRLCGARTGLDVPMIGLYQTGRSATFEGLDRLAGPCLNILPLAVSATESIESVARGIQTDLGRRSNYEQSSLVDVAKWIGHEGRPLFNVFVNLLWHGERTRSAKDAVFRSMSVGAAPLLIFMSEAQALAQVGVPTDFAPQTAFGGATAVDSLSFSHLPKVGLPRMASLYVPAGAEHAMRNSRPCTWMSS